MRLKAQVKLRISVLMKGTGGLREAVRSDAGASFVPPGDHYFKPAQLCLLAALRLIRGVVSCFRPATWKPVMAEPLSCRALCARLAMLTHAAVWRFLDCRLECQAVPSPGAPLPVQCENAIMHPCMWSKVAASMQLYHNLWWLCALAATAAAGMLNAYNTALTICPSKKKTRQSW